MPEDEEKMVKIIPVAMELPVEAYAYGRRMYMYHQIDDPSL